MNTAYSAEIKPNDFTVEEYHALINKPLPQLPAQEVIREQTPRNYYLIQNNYVRGRGPIILHSTIFEGSTESVQTTSSSCSSGSSIMSRSSINSLNPYGTVPTYDYRNAILSMTSDLERSTTGLTNEQSIITRTNTSETADTLVNTPSRQNTPESSDESHSRLFHRSSRNNLVGLLEREHRVSYSDLGYGYRRNSITELPRSTSPVSIAESNLQDDID
jgi:hypothetical protein